MAISKRNKRKIKYGNDEYYYSVYRHSSKDNLTLRVISEEKSFSQLICEFNHKDIWLYFSEGTGDIKNLTPQIIKESIEYGLANGWNPNKKEKHLIIKNMDKILGIKSSEKFNKNSITEIRNHENV